MGGFFKLIVREKDGTLHTQERVTSILPFFFKSNKFSNEDQAHFEEFVACHKSEVRTTKEPVGYGIVVLDYVTKTVLSCQGYSNFNFIPTYLVELYVHDDVRSFQNHGYQLDEIEEFKRLFENKKIEFYRLSRGRGKDYDLIEFDSSDKSFLTELIKKDEEGIIRVNGFNLNMSPFNYIRYSDDDLKNYLNLKTKMVELGFNFSEKENELWDLYIKERTGNDI